MPSHTVSKHKLHTTINLKLNEEDVKSYETITSKAKFGSNLKEVNAYVTGPLFLSVGDTLFGQNGEDVKGTNWGNEAGVNVLKFIAAQKKRQQRIC